MKTRNTPLRPERFLKRLLPIVFILSVIASGSAMAQKRTCRAVDLIDSNGNRPMQGQQIIKDESAYKWKIQGLQAGEITVELNYSCEGAGGSKVILELGAQTLETIIENTSKDNKKRAKSKTVSLGTLKVDQGDGVFSIRALRKGDDPVIMKLRHLAIEGAPLSLAVIDGYSLPAPERNPVDVPDLGVANNTLTEKEKKDGWKLLFNGRDLTGWSGYRKDAAPPAWVVKDGAIFLDKASKKAGGDLISINSYRDFDLVVEWKIAPHGNSGIIIRTHENKRAPYETAIEMQVHDPANCNNPLTAPGAAYALYGPEKNPAEPAGEWNKARIRVEGNHYQMWLNDSQTANFTVGSDDWNSKVEAAKWRDYPSFGHNTRGHIDLQDHGAAVSYRNMKLRNL
jgi:hypothetical protein